MHVISNGNPPSRKGSETGAKLRQVRRGADANIRQSSSTEKLEVRTANARQLEQVLFF